MSQFSIIARKGNRKKVNMEEHKLKVLLHIVVRTALM